MICAKCKKQNNKNANFCRFCGSDSSKFIASNSSKDKEKFISIKIPNIRIPKIDLRRLFSHGTKKLFLLIIILLFVSVGGVFAAPKLNDYFAINKIIKEINEAEQEYNYMAALAMINITDEFKITNSKTEKIQQLKEQESIYLNYQQLFHQAKKSEENGNFIEAREILNSIGVDFPEYNKVQEKLNEIQTKIENALETKIKVKEEEVRRTTAAKAAAEKRTQEETKAKKEAQAQTEIEAAAKRQAEARAQSEAAAKARVQAEADASARAARESEYQRQKEEEEKLEQVKISFCNQLNRVYDSVSDGIDYYNRAMSYYSAGDGLVALAVFGQARVVFESANNDSTDIRNNFSNADYSYISAADNMKNASYHYLAAVNAVMDDISSDTYGGVADNYGAVARGYGIKVVNFLNSECY